MRKLPKYDFKSDSYYEITFLRYSYMYVTYKINFYLIFKSCAIQQFNIYINGILTLI